jgi:hypothetical protein
MTDRHILRFGGASGLLFVILFIPSYLSAPDSPVATSSTQQVIDYFSSKQNEILILNGLLLIVSAFFFLGFLGILHGLLQGAEREGYGFSSVSLAGGVLFITLVLAGAAIEIVHPATQTRFANFQQDAQLSFLSLALSGWMYRFAFVGMAALIAATSLVALRTGLLPKWLAWVGFVCTVIALLRFLGPLGGWLTLLWIVVVSVLMLAGTVGRPFVATPVPRH